MVTGDHSLETIASWLERLYEQAGACHIQLSGGEPTLRDDLDAIIRIARDIGFSYLQLNTNGLRLAAEPSLALRLKEAGLTCVFLQFDGIDDLTHLRLRGARLQTQKEAAVEACAVAGLPVILVPTLAQGINEHELIPLIRYGMSKSPTVRGVHIQFLAHFGRVDVAAARFTIESLLTFLEEQSEQMIKTSHFSGGNAEHPNCSFNAHYFIADEGNLELSGVQRQSCCGEGVDSVGLAQEVQARRWGTDLSGISDKPPTDESMDYFLWQTKARSFSITGMAYMDEETLDKERLQRCYLFILDHQGRPIPFCAYNIAHRGTGGELTGGRIKCQLSSKVDTLYVPLSTPVSELAFSYRVNPALPGSLTEPELRVLQLQRLNETLSWARQHCDYHAERLPTQPLKSLEELCTLPLMDHSAFAQGMGPLLGLEQNALSRIVTVPTSGTTDTPKRIAFTESEHRDIVLYLSSGMRMLAGPGETIAVLFPCDRSGGLGQLICEGVEQLPARACAYGLPDATRGFAELAQTCIDQQVRGLVGFSQHIFSLARWCEYNGIKLPVRSVLLSADNIVPSLKREIERIWQARVYAHYGTTEMGFGGAVECGSRQGQHIRETDLLFEVIDPHTDEVLPPGEWGELVFTSLTRKAMPFIRYRTGDSTRLLPGSCACGSLLRRIDVVKGREDDNAPWSLYDLEDLIFSCPGVLDFAAHWKEDSASLNLEVQLLPGYSLDKERLGEALKARSRKSGGSTVAPLRLAQSTTNSFAPFFPAKRSFQTIF